MGGITNAAIGTAAAATTEENPTQVQLNDLTSKLQQQELFIAELITWLREYYPNMGYSPELRAQEWKQLVENIKLISNGQPPIRRPAEEMELADDKKSA